MIRSAFLLLYSFSFFYKYLERVCSLQFLIFTDHYVFVCDHIIDIRSRLNYCILHEHTVTDFRTALDLNAPEQDTVLHITFDHTAVCRVSLSCTWSDCRHGSLYKSAPCQKEHPDYSHPAASCSHRNSSSYPKSAHCILQT